ncbi:MAG: hypothetical protein WKG07_11955 [Hymenobacter sp.]
MGQFFQVGWGHLQAAEESLAGAVGRIDGKQADGGAVQRGPCRNRGFPRRGPARRRRGAAMAGPGTDRPGTVMPASSVRRRGPISSPFRPLRVHWRCGAVAVGPPACARTAGADAA